MTRFHGKVAIVTGSSQGVGYTIAKKLAAQGAKVVISARNQKACQTVADEISAEGGTAAAISCDIADAASRSLLVDKTLETFGDVDILVNNVAIGFMESLFECSEEHLRSVLSTNTVAPIMLGQRVAQEMAARRHGGQIINIVSTAAFRGEYNSTAYCASKAALVLATKCMALELGVYGIRANCVAPGMTVTNVESRPEEVLEGLRAITPTGRLSISEDIADAVAFLASESAGNITGITLPVDGGFSSVAISKACPPVPERGR